MAWQIKVQYNGLPHIRWLNKDARGFFSTSQGKARYFDSKTEADTTRDDAEKACPGVSFSVVEIPG